MGQNLSCSVCSQSTEDTFMLLHEYVTSLNPSSNYRMWVRNEFKEDLLKFTNVFMQTQGGAVTASCHFLVYCTTGGLEPFHPLCAEIYHRLASTCVLFSSSQKMLCTTTQLPHNLSHLTRERAISVLFLHSHSDCAYCPVSGYCVRLQSFCK